MLEGLAGVAGSAGMPFLAYLINVALSCCPWRWSRPAARKVAGPAFSLRISLSQASR
jgi:hypothetical protein